jgi:hypothetical protein
MVEFLGSIESDSELQNSIGKFVMKPHKNMAAMLGKANVEMRQSGYSQALGARGMRGNRHRNN